jgi:hypothetical protein
VSTSHDGNRIAPRGKITAHSRNSVTAQRATITRQQNNAWRRLEHARVIGPVAVAASPSTLDTVDDSDAERRDADAEVTVEARVRDRDLPPEPEGDLVIAGLNVSSAASFSSLARLLASTLAATTAPLRYSRSCTGTLSSRSTRSVPEEGPVERIAADTEDTDRDRDRDTAGTMSHRRSDSEERYKRQQRPHAPCTRTVVTVRAAQSRAAQRTAEHSKEQSTHRRRRTR